MVIDKLRRRFRPYLQILLSMVGFLIVSFTVWRYTRFQDVGGNLLASAIQLFFTFLIFERLLVRQKETEEFPRKLSAYEDLCTWFNQLTWFYQAAYRAANPGQPAKKIEDICTIDFFRGISPLNLETEAPVFPTKTWEQYIVKQSTEFTEKGLKIVEHDGDRIPPEVCRAMHVFLKSPFFAIQKLITTMREIEAKFPQAARPRLWRFYSTEPSKEEIQALTAIHNWLTEFHVVHVREIPKLVKVPGTW